MVTRKSPPQEPTSADDTLIGSSSGSFNDVTDGSQQAADPITAALDQLASEANPPPLGEGVTELDVAHRQQVMEDIATGNAGVLMKANAIVRDMLVEVAKHESPKTTMADERAATPMRAAGEVLAKHGVDLKKLAGGYEAEIAAAMLLWSYGMPIYAGVKAEIKARPTTEIGAAPRPMPKAPDDKPGTMYGPTDPRNAPLGQG